MKGDTTATVHSKVSSHFYIEGYQVSALCTYSGISKKTHMKYCIWFRRRVKLHENVFIRVC